MKALISILFTTILAISLSACGCSNSAQGNTQTPGTTILPEILPSMETNIPDPEVNTEMPIYTESTENATGSESIIPTETKK